MKCEVSCVLLLCVAGALAGVLPLTTGVGKQAQGLNHAVNQARDVAQNNAVAQNAAAVNKDFGRVNQIQEDKAHQAANANQAAGNQYGQAASNHDKAFNNAAKTASQSAAAAASQNAARSNNAKQAAAKDAFTNVNRNFRNNNAQKDRVDYAYDKRFDLNNNQNGGYVFAADDNAHVLDDIYARDRAYDRNVDNYAAAANAQNRQAANRFAQGQQNQAANQAAHDKFGRNADNANQANAAQSLHSNRLDTGNQANTDWNQFARGANELLKNGLFRNVNQKQAGKNFGAADKQIGYGGFGLAPYYSGSLGLPGFGKDFASATGAVNAGYASDVGANNRLGNQGLFGQQDLSKSAFSRDQWLNDNNAAVANNQANWLNDQGFADKAALAQQAANAFNGDAAAAANDKNNAQKLNNFNEDAKFADSTRKNLADRNKNNRVFQKFFNNNNQNGNNWERLNYDNDRINDQLAYDNTVRQDSARNAQNAAQNVAEAADANQANRARADDAASNNQAQDWARAAKGYQNQQAAANSNQAAARAGIDNSSWKVDSLDQRGNNAHQNQNLWDKGAQDYRNDAKFFGGNFGARGLYPGAYGGYRGGFGGLSPGYGFY